MASLGSAGVGEVSSSQHGIPRVLSLLLKNTLNVQCCVADLMHLGIIQCDKRKFDSGGESRQGN
jgi:hypothetical protein